MRLINTTKKRTIVTNLVSANTFIAKSIGLILSKPEDSLTFNTRWGIHTFFMSHPIDIAILDTDLTVRKTVSSLPPFRFCFYNPYFSIVIELPSGSLAASNTVVGDKMTVIK